MAEQLNPEKVQDFAKHVIGYLGGAAVASMVYLGDRLGMYRQLNGAGALSSAELASRTNLNERWVREWLYAQASAGLVEYVGEGKFRLPPEQAAVLADESHPAFVAGGFTQVLSLLETSKRLPEAFRTGRGLTYDDLGEEHAIGMERFLSPWLRANLVPVVLPSLAGVTGKLRAGAKVADIGCGAGRAAIAVAEAFPASEIHGYDNSKVAIELANRNKEAAGVPNVEFHLVSAQGLPANPSFDFITAFDCLHDMTDPVAAMTAVRRALKPDGTWLIGEMNGRPTFEENLTQHPLAPIMYSFSVLCCMSSGLSDEGGAGLGTLGLPEPRLQAMLQEAGFSQIVVHDHAHPLNMFYEVRI